MKINREKAIEWWMDELHEELNSGRKQLLEEYLDQHPELRGELAESSSTWDALEQVDTPTPSSDMEVRFQAMLAGYQSATTPRSNLRETVSLWFSTNWRTSLSSLCIGLLIGFLLLPGGDDREVQALSEEVSQMKKMLMLSMIEKPQAQERIRAVNMMDDLASSDERVISSLVNTLNNDKSLNVRLAALDALVRYGKHANVREALVKSIVHQDSPLLQVALADVMILLQEKEAIGAFEHVLQDSPVDESVRSKLESTIETLKEI